MPVLVGTVTAPTTPTPDLPNVPRRPADPGRPEAVWIAPDGTEWQLTSDTDLHFTLDAWSNVAGAAPVSIVADPHPRGGARVRHIQPQPRTITWPMRVRADTHLELVHGWRALVTAFTQTRRLGPGTLRVMRPDGDAREIRCYYQAGFDGEPEQGWLYDTAVLSLYCEDPYWRDAVPVSLPYQQSTGASYLNPYLTVSPSSVLGATTAFNKGDAEGWTTWSITGPATAITATNNTTGDSFTLTATLTAGQTATITTDPPAVRGPAGENWSSKLNWPGAVLWGLEPGLNDITFAVTGSTTATRVVLSYTARYETA